MLDLTICFDNNQFFDYCVTPTIDTFMLILKHIADRWDITQFMVVIAKRIKT